ncbi:MAG: hypothetical protein ABIN25_05085 [Ginsengibacter sp.]
MQLRKFYFHITPGIAGLFSTRLAEPKQGTKDNGSLFPSLADY